MLRKERNEHVVVFWDTHTDESWRILLSVYCRIILFLDLGLFDLFVFYSSVAEEKYTKYIKHVTCLGSKEGRCHQMSLLLTFIDLTVFFCRRSVVSSWALCMSV